MGKISEMDKRNLFLSSIYENSMKIYLVIKSEESEGVLDFKPLSGDVQRWWSVSRDKKESKRVLHVERRMVLIYFTPYF